MLEIWPKSAFEFECPGCHSAIAATEWLIPGMWTLGGGKCDACGKLWWSELPYSLGFLAPTSIDRTTGEVFRPAGGDWYREATTQAYRNRSNAEVNVEKVVRKPARRVCLVNCLMPWWGDAVSLLFRSNQLFGEDVDLVALVPRGLEGYVPERFCETWIVNAPLSQMGQWSEGLANWIKREVETRESCSIPTTFQPAYHPDGKVAEFTGTAPFDRSKWSETLAEGCVVTFLLRDDRCWASLPDVDLPFPSKMPGRGRVKRLLDRSVTRICARQQRNRVIACGRRLRRELPSVRIAVCGPSVADAYPDWITDLRAQRIDAAVNKQWEEQAARSNVLVSVLGSHATLPSAHAGAVITLVPDSFLPNVLTDVIATVADAREALFLYRMLPATTSAESIATTILTILYNYPYLGMVLRDKFHRSLDSESRREVRDGLKARSEALVKAKVKLDNILVGP